jgi:hypothetical protein
MQHVLAVIEAAILPRGPSLMIAPDLEIRLDWFPLHVLETQLMECVWILNDHVSYDALRVEQVLMTCESIIPGRENRPSAVLLHANLQIWPQRDAWRT